MFRDSPDSKLRRLSSQGIWRGVGNIGLSAEVQGRRPQGDPSRMDLVEVEAQFDPRSRHGRGVSRGSQLVARGDPVVLAGADASAELGRKAAAAHVPTDGGQRECAGNSTMDAGFPVYAVCQVRAAESVEEHEQILMR